MDLTPLFTAIGSGGIAGAVAIWYGHRAKRQTEHETIQTGDRAQFISDLRIDIDCLKTELVDVKRREMSLIRLLSYIGGEMTVFSGYLAMVYNDILTDEQINKEFVLKNLNEMQGRSGSVKKMIDLRLQSILNEISESEVKIVEQESTKETKEK